MRVASNSGARRLCAGSRREYRITVRQNLQSSDSQISKFTDSTIDCENVMSAEILNDLTARLARIERAVDLLVRQRTVKDWYSTAEVAQLLGKAEFTVREWCRLGRVKAEKKKCGRGVAGEWIVSHEELTRVRNEGLLPEPNPYRHVR